MNNLERFDLRYVLLIAMMLVVPVFVYGQQPTTADRVAAFKQSLGQNKVRLSKYQWIETTTVMLKGEVKSVKQKQCYYGPDGKVQKVDITPPAPAAQPSGGRLKQRIVAHKKEELTDYMKEAVALIEQYVPPDPELIQFSKATNNIQVTPPNQSGVLRVNIPNFIKTGDLLSGGLNVLNNSIADINVSTFVDSPKDVVTLAVNFSTLPDGTSYSGRTVLDAQAKDVKVVVENSGYRPR